MFNMATLVVVIHAENYLCTQDPLLQPWGNLLRGIFMTYSVVIQT